MTEEVHDRLEEALEAVRRLPEAAQTVIAAEILDRVADFGFSRLDDAQRSEVLRRLSGPRRIADDADVERFFKRFGAL